MDCFAILTLFLFNNLCSHQVSFSCFFQANQVVAYGSSSETPALTVRLLRILFPILAPTFTCTPQASARRRVIADKPPISPDAALMPPGEISKR
jgi:hypothetical protein